MDSVLFRLRPLSLAARAVSPSVATVLTGTNATHNYLFQPLSVSAATVLHRINRADRRDPRYRISATAAGKIYRRALAAVSGET